MHTNQVVVTAECDSCGKEIEMVASSPKRGAELIEKMGWELRGDGNTCPDCVRKAKHAKG